MNDLMLHHSGQILSYEDLKAVPTPLATATWTPIPHFELLDGIKRQLAMDHLVITREVLAISHGALGTPGDRFFGLLEIQSQDQNYSLTIGVRNGHDRSIVAGLCVGSQVFVCSNLAFSAEVVISRKHTRFIRRDLPRLISDAMGRLGDLRDHQSQRIEAYQNTALSDPQLNDLAIRSLDAGVLAASKLPHLLAEYREPAYEEFRPRTVWSAFCAYTETLKDYDLQTLPRRTQALHGLCDMICGLS